MTEIDRLRTPNDELVVSLRQCVERLEHSQTDVSITGPSIRRAKKLIAVTQRRPLPSPTQRTMAEYWQAMAAKVENFDDFCGLMDALTERVASLGLSFDYHIRPRKPALQGDTRVIQPDTE